MSSCLWQRQTVGSPVAILSTAILESPWSKPVRTDCLLFDDWEYIEPTLTDEGTIICSWFLSVRVKFQ